jgi:SAM-dependent methyltransferase
MSIGENMANQKDDNKSLQRKLLNKNLEPILKTLKGRILDTGGAYSPYKSIVKATKYAVLDIDPKFKPNYVADVHDMKIIKNQSFDAIIATELLEHCYNPQQVINEFKRVLASKGKIVLSVPFLYPYHPDPYDYYRYTEDGLRHLFREYKKIKIIKYGGRIAFFWEMITWTLPFLKIFNSMFSKITPTASNCPSGYIVIAEK